MPQKIFLPLRNHDYRIDHVALMWDCSHHIFPFCCVVSTRAFFLKAQAFFFFACLLPLAPAPIIIALTFHNLCCFDSTLSLTDKAHNNVEDRQIFFCLFFFFT